MAIALYGSIIRIKKKMIELLTKNVDRNSSWSQTHFAFNRTSKSRVVRFFHIDEYERRICVRIDKHAISFS